MYSLIQLLAVRSAETSLNRSLLRRGFLPIPLAIALACLSLSPAPNAFGVSPPPDGGYPNQNTAEGDNALFSLISGTDNTATGFDALQDNPNGFNNTATGVATLAHNDAGNNNTATGFNALTRQAFASNNTANGANALFSNRTGTKNTASGLTSPPGATTSISGIKMWPARKKPFASARWELT